MEFLHKSLSISHIYRYTPHIHNSHSNQSFISLLFSKRVSKGTAPASMCSISHINFWFRRPLRKIKASSGAPGRPVSASDGSHTETSWPICGGVGTNSRIMHILRYQALPYQCMHIRGVTRPYRLATRFRRRPRLGLEIHLLRRICFLHCYAIIVSDRFAF